MIQPGIIRRRIPETVEILLLSQRTVCPVLAHRLQFFPQARLGVIALREIIVGKTRRQQFLCSRPAAVGHSYILFQVIFVGGVCTAVSPGSLQLAA
ncbi:unknown [Bacteroides sp. CAG:927]|nr:unknown [Bacteroides sp. CAG:927]